MAIDPNQMQPGLEPEPVITPSAEPAPQPASAIEIEGETIPIDDIKAWRDAHENRDKWQRSLKQKDQQYAQVRQHLESAFGRRFGEFTPNDLADLQAFGIFNQKLRTDGDFRRRWHEALVQAGKEEGMTPKQAEAAATQTVKEQVAQGTPGQQPAQQPATQPAQPAVPAVPPQTLKDLEELRNSVRSLQQMQVQQTLSALESHIDDRIKQGFAKYAGDMPESHDEIRERVLYRLLGYDDSELYNLARSGELAGIIDEASKDATAKIKGYVEKFAKTRVPAATAAKKAAPTTPFKGQPASPAKTEPVGIRAMHDRLMKEFGQVPS